MPARMPGISTLCARIFWPFRNAESLLGVLLPANSASQAAQPAGAVAEGINADAGSIQHRQVEIHQRRLTAEAQVLARVEGTAALAGEQDWQLVVVVAVAVTVARAVDDHAAVQKRAVPLLDRLQLAQQVGH